ncbi:MAG TPA: NAD(P)-dependent alcohol dehydrogenase, partial [Candidatus Dormibacteraeota bacterium]|nr:NAD(P)-dependent alcohol dehydrogenase [Candidatus Dormibacteraeota bacterium]
MVTAVPTSMKAYLCAGPTSLEALRVTELPLPAVPDDGVLIRVHASSTNPVDLFPLSLAGYLMAGRKPVILGTDFSGVVESVGSAVRAFRPGDEVFGGGKGAFAEYMCVSESRAIALKPSSVPFADAGVVAVAGGTALQAVRDHGRLERGQNVLINGASGGVGTFAVQIARAFGGHVTAVCSTRNVETVRALGAETVIDYTQSDFTRSGLRYDLIIDIAGSHSFLACKRVLAPGGRFVGVGAAALQHRGGGGFRAIGHFLGTRITSIGSGHRLVSLFIASLKHEDMAFLGELMADGRIKPVIDTRYSLAEVPDALRQ